MRRDGDAASDDTVGRHVAQNGVLAAGKRLPSGLCQRPNHTITRDLGDCPHANHRVRRYALNVVRFQDTDGTMKSLDAVCPLWLAAPVVAGTCGLAHG